MFLVVRRELLKLKRKKRGGEEMSYGDGVNFSVLVGRTLKSIENKGEEIIFETTDGERYKQSYYSDCCASCSVEEIHGDLEDLVGFPILMAEEVSNKEPDAALIASRTIAYETAKAEFKPEYEFYWSGPSPDNDWEDDSETWTFYKAATIKGSVTIRWYGSSNGYYSESPTFEKLK